MRDYHPLPATRADLLTRLGRIADAVAACDEVYRPTGRPRYETTTLRPNTGRGRH